jgi:hypothetical protein
MVEVHRKHLRLVVVVPVSCLVLLVVSRENSTGDLTPVRVCSDSTPAPSKPNANARAAAKPVDTKEETVRITFYKNGFTVDDDTCVRIVGVLLCACSCSHPSNSILRNYTDAHNAEFLTSIQNGRMPKVSVNNGKHPRCASRTREITVGVCFTGAGSAIKALVHQRRAVRQVCVACVAQCLARRSLTVCVCVVRAQKERRLVAAARRAAQSVLGCRTDTRVCCACVGRGAGIYSYGGVVLCADTAHARAAQRQRALGRQHSRTLCLLVCVVSLLTLCVYGSATPSSTTPALPIGVSVNADEVCMCAWVVYVSLTHCASQPTTSLQIRLLDGACVLSSCVCV